MQRNANVLKACGMHSLVFQAMGMQRLFDADLVSLPQLQHIDKVVVLAEETGLFAFYDTADIAQLHSNRMFRLRCFFENGNLRVATGEGLCSDARQHRIPIKPILLQQRLQTDAQFTDILAKLDRFQVPLTYIPEGFLFERASHVCFRSVLTSAAPGSIDVSAG